MQTFHQFLAKKALVLPNLFRIEPFIGLAQPIPLKPTEGQGSHIVGSRAGEESRRFEQVQNVHQVALRFSSCHFLHTSRFRSRLASLRSESILFAMSSNHEKASSAVGLSASLTIF